MIDGIAILQEIERKHGTVTADNVVEEARDEGHPWHSRFDWDDNTAAVSWRKMQARHLIRSVRFERRVQERTLAAPVYVRDPSVPGDQQAYISIVKLASDEDKARAAILAEFRRAASALKRAREVAQALDLAAEIESFLVQVDGLMFSIQHQGGASPAPATVQ